MRPGFGAEQGRAKGCVKRGLGTGLWGTGTRGLRFGLVTLGLCLEGPLTALSPGCRRSLGLVSCGRVHSSGSSAVALLHSGCWSGRAGPFWGLGWPALPEVDTGEQAGRPFGPWVPSLALLLDSPLLFSLTGWQLRVSCVLQVTTPRQGRGPSPACVSVLGGTARSHGHGVDVS